MKFKITIILLIIFQSLPAASQFNKVVVLSDKIKLRSCDNLECNVINVLPIGSVCDILGYGREETLENYGTNRWISVQFKNKVGFVYGGFVQNQPNNFSPPDKTSLGNGYIREENVNIRSCPELKNCKILFQLNKGQYCKVISKTDKIDEVAGMGKHPWYLIEIDRQRGYVFGALLVIQTSKIIIDSINVRLYDQPNQKVIHLLDQNKKHTIISQSKKSEVIRPFGRHYWYKIKNNEIPTGWVYGAFTSKSSSPVDCQCVDFVKNKLSITGPTKNAFEWDQVLFGNIPVTIKGKYSTLNYEEIFDHSKLTTGDVVIFDKLHSQVDQRFGHIAFLKKIKKENHKQYVVVEGGNHQVPLRYFYNNMGCNNISLKAYQLNQYVRFFRPHKI